MGGTFDPIHYGHLVAAEASRQEFKLEKVIFVPAGIPPHKKDQVITPANQRFEMTLLAVVGNPGFEISRVEIDRGGCSFTIDTIRHFRKLYGEEAALYFITGADAISEILTWKDARELMELTEFIAVTRPGFSLFPFLEGTPVNDPRCRVHVLEVPGLAVSSTEIRKRVGEGRSI
ncbi:MAG: nicotinate-nucleotide adenylyltransferase, partial [Clostridia bacterium]|nr:nicotinate-nucleotide adenylyltransferase [Clostridia bacterium]